MGAASLLYIRTLLLLTGILLFQSAISQFYITTIAGNGTFGTSGNNSPAVCAGVPNPTGVCADPTGNVYIADTANIYVFVKMVMPNVFTPNGDGVNDVFRIRANVTFQLDEFSVYNRWGKKVFTTADISKGWNGEDAVNGTYVYVISGVLEGKKTIFKGTFVLTR